MVKSHELQIPPGTPIAAVTITPNGDVRVTYNCYVTNVTVNGRSVVPVDGEMMEIARTPYSVTSRGPKRRR